MLCEAETLYYVNNKLMVWAMPISTFTAFDEVYVLTYQFDCQIQKYYYDYFGIDYKYFHIENIDLISSKYFLSLTNDINGVISQINDSNDLIALTLLKQDVPVLYSPYTIDFGDLYNKDNMDLFFSYIHLLLSIH